MLDDLIEQVTNFLGKSAVPHQGAAP